MAYKQKGMSFGEGTGYKAPQSSNLKAEWSKNEAGYDVKTTRRKNLFGRERVVEKYFDPETGEKLGKQVTVDRGKNDPRAKKVKIKKVNPGLTQSGGVGKIRLDENPWDKPSGKTETPPTDEKKPPNEGTNGEDTKINRAQLGSQWNIEKDHDFDVTYDEDGNPELDDYATSFGKFPIKDGKRYNPRNKKYYSNDKAGLQEYEDDAEAWWAEQAELTDNEKLKKQNQEYGVDEEGNVKYTKPK
jgi:hypothetical protein